MKEDKREVKGAESVLVYIGKAIERGIVMQSKLKRMGPSRLPFSELAILLLPLQQMASQHVHHLDAAEFFKVFLMA